MVHATLHEQEIRQIVGVPGPGELVVDGVASLDAPEDRCLYFINRNAGAAVCASLAARQGCIVIVPRGSALTGELGACRILETDDPRAAISKVLGFIHAQHRQPPLVAALEIDARAVISPLAAVEGDVEIGERSIVEPFCTLGPDVIIGRGTVVRSGARIYPRVSIGDDTVIGANTVVGAPGYGFVRDEAGNKTRIPHLAGVVIGSHVEIGALAVVQSGAIRPTVIEDHAKIDDNVEVAHGARIGRGASITGGVVIGGSAVVETEAWLGVNSSVRDGRRVGARALVGMDVSVQQDLADYSVARAPRPQVVMRPADDDVTAIGFAGRPKTAR